FPLLDWSFGVGYSYHTEDDQYQKEGLSITERQLNIGPKKLHDTQGKPDKEMLYTLCCLVSIRRVEFFVFYIVPNLLYNTARRDELFAR
ncbi:hypothetical protein, partial [Peribacillus simplex]|uniref:hypothetical protein n=1 Tax=Peribacillus simplex TaxID=1478 RepID=UPI003D2D56D6